MTLEMDWYNHLINVLAPQTTVLIQDLYDFIQDQQVLFPGIVNPEVCTATGKDSLGSGVTTGITLSLNSPWRLRFWDGSYIATVKGGNLVGGLSGQPIEYSPGVQVLLIQSAASTIVTTGGSALTTEEHDKLMTGLDVSVPDGVWDELRSGHTTSGTYGATSEWVSGAVSIFYKYVASDNGTTANFGVWGEENGEPVTDFDSISLKIFDLDGTEIADLGTETSQTSEGVFHFSVASTVLSNATAYYVKADVSRGGDSWDYKFGLSVAG